MKAKLDFRSKRTIIVTAIIAALAVGAGVGGYFYAKGNNEASAATNISDASQTATEQAPSGDNNQGTPDSNANNGNGNGGTTPTDGATGDNAGNDGAANDGANANGNAGNAGNGGAANAGNAGNAGAAGNAGGAGAGNAGNGAAGNAGAGAGDNDGDATTTTWESHETSWRPQTLNVSTPEVNVNKNKISVAKTAITSTGYNTVSAGDSITYTITVTNNNTETLNSLYISDEIPEGTTFDSIENGGETVKENDVVTRVYWNLWNLGIEAGKTYSVSFKVTVNKDAKGTIKNVATVEGEPSNKNEDGDPEPTKNPVIKSNKNASLVETDKDDDGNDVEKVTDLKDEKVKEGQIIRYTISVENTSKEEKATTKVSDTVPEGTTLQGEEGKEVTVVNGEETTTYAIANLNEGIELTLDKESKATVSFDVKVNKDTPKFIKNTATVGGETPTTENEVYMDIEVSKKWEDADDQDGKRPNEIKLVLYKTVGEKTEEAEKVTVTARNKWKYTFKDLAKFDGDNEITYSVEEELTDVVTGTDAAGTYKVDKAGEYKTGITITNTHTPELVNDNTGIIAVEKEWDDKDNQDGMRKEVTIQLYKVTTGEDGKETLTEVEGKTVTIKADATGEELKAKFDKLPKYEEGKEIKYTVRETTKVANYEEPVVTGDQAKGFKVTNTHTPETTEVSGEKTWVDGKYKDKTRPESITINLLADGEPALDDNGKAITANVTEGKDKTWKYSFTGLDKYKNGKVIKYTITENKLENYTTEINKYDVKNTLKTTEVSVHKTWIDAENNKKHPTIKIYLYQNVDEITEETEPYDSVSLENGTIDYTFRDLPKVDAQGKEYSYKVAEEDVIGYKSTMSGDATSGYTITNTQETTTATVIKVWDDEDDLDGVRPNNITVQLKADGSNYGSETVLSKDTEGIDVKIINNKETWIYTFTNLPKVNDKNKNYEYTAVETKIGDDSVSNNKTDDYTVSTATADEGLNTTTIANTHIVERISVDVSKEWIDGNRSHTSDTITVKLLADGKDTKKTVKLSDSNKWKDSFTGLRKYINGKEVEYTVEEANVPSGYTSKITGSPSKGYKITNTLNKPRSVTLTKHYTETSQTEVKVPIDVVFILDTSTSMRTIQEGSHSRAYNMVEAVNATINELKESNSQNRISIVGYSDTASVIMPLKEASKVSKNPLSYSSYTISCSGGTPRSVDGGTYTQSGIALGTQQLIDVRDKTVEIQDQILTRVPVIILLSDGMPTYYTTDYDDVNATSTSGRSGNGYNETVEQGYYTIMSADYYKGEVTKEYRKTNKKITAKMYTVAVNVNSQYGLTVLNPITDNINNLKDSTGYISDEKYPNGKYYADRNFYKLLNGEKYQGLAKSYNSYYEIERDPKDLEDFNASRKNDDGYSYADFAYTNNVDKETLLANMKAAIDEATPKYITTQATQAEIDSYMVEIKDLDYSKDMTIKANGETYNKSKVVTEIDGKYYLDLTKFPNNCDITVDYQSI